MTDGLNRLGEPAIIEQCSLFHQFRSEYCLAAYGPNLGPHLGRLAPMSVFRNRRMKAVDWLPTLILIVSRSVEHIQMQPFYNQPAVGMKLITEFIIRISL